MGLILYIISLIVTIPFNVFGLITILFNKDRNKILKDLAISKDQLSNVYVQYYFNWLMLSKKSVNLFGNPDETISSVFGKNKRAKTLTRFGKYWADWLNKREENHVELSIEDDEY